MARRIQLLISPLMTMIFFPYVVISLAVLFLFGWDNENVLGIEWFIVIVIPSVSLIYFEMINKHIDKTDPAIFIVNFPIMKNGWWVFSGISLFIAILLSNNFSDEIDEKIKSLLLFLVILTFGMIHPLFKFNSLVSTTKFHIILCKMSAISFSKTNTYSTKIIHLKKTLNSYNLLIEKEYGIFISNIGKIIIDYMTNDIIKKKIDDCLLSSLSKENTLLIQIFKIFGKEKLDVKSRNFVDRHKIDISIIISSITILISVLSFLNDT